MKKRECLGLPSYSPALETMAEKADGCLFRAIIQGRLSHGGWSWNLHHNRFRRRSRHFQHTNHWLSFL